MGQLKLKKMAKRKPTSKYLSKKTVVDGITFDSKKESERYLHLKHRERNGEIKDLQLQVPFVVLPAQYEEVEEYTPKKHRKKVVKRLLERKIEYVADFVYTENEHVIVEDVKGYRNSAAYAIFVMKRKLMLYFYGITIHEV